jgi:hypothetical protein
MSVVDVGTWLSGVGCRVFTVDCRMSLSVVVVGTWLSGVGCRVLTFDCRMSMSVVVVGTWLSGVGCRVLTIDCRMSMSVVVVGTWLSGIGCRLWTVDCRNALFNLFFLLLQYSILQDSSSLNFLRWGDSSSAEQIICTGLPAEVFRGWGAGRGNRTRDSRTAVRRAIN